MVVNSCPMNLRNLNEGVIIQQWIPGRSFSLRQEFAAGRQLCLYTFKCQRPNALFTFRDFESLQYLYYIAIQYVNCNSWFVSIIVFGTNIYNFYLFY